MSQIDTRSPWPTMHASQGYAHRRIVAPHTGPMVAVAPNPKNAKNAARETRRARVREQLRELRARAGGGQHA